MRAGISFPYLLFSPYLPLRPSRRTPRNLAFFRRFPRRAGCNPVTPIVVGRGWRRKARREGRRRWRRRRASYYICNIFAFTIFQLVCILEPLLPLAHTWRAHDFFPSPPPHSSFPHRHWWMLHFTLPLHPPSCLLPSIATSPSRAAIVLSTSFLPARALLLWNHSSEARKGFHFLK